MAQADKQWRVTIGTPARNRTAIVEAADVDAAVKAAIEQFVAGGDSREWCEKYAANRDKRTGTCKVEQNN